MYAEVLSSIAGIGVFPIISLLLFVAVFGGVIVWAWRADGARLEQIAAIPLDEPVLESRPHVLKSGGDL